MIRKLRKKFIVTALLSVFALLAVILLVINFVNFSLVADDADRVLDRLVGQGGDFPADYDPQQNAGQPAGPMGEEPRQGPRAMDGHTPRVGPDSLEIGQTTRYFTVVFDADGNVSGQPMMRVNAISQEEAVRWATEVLGKKKGWTHTYYRYRVWTQNSMTMVTVIDQSRELLPSYRVLIASCVGAAVGLVVTFLALLGISKVVVGPIEQSDRKQKRFIGDASYELKTPITVIDANRQLLEESVGPLPETQAIAKQVGHLTRLVQGLDTLLALEERPAPAMKEVDMTALVNEVAAPYVQRFVDQNKGLTLSVAEGVTAKGDDIRLSDLVVICLDNALLYAVSQATVTLRREDERTTLSFVNDATGLTDGPLDSVFERFYRSEDVRAGGIDGAGVSLSVAKQIVDLHHGRVMASAKDGNFVLKIEL